MKSAQPRVENGIGGVTTENGDKTNSGKSMEDAALPTLAEIQRNWKSLDGRSALGLNVELISHERFSHCGEEVKYIAPGAVCRALRLIPGAYSLFYALQLLVRCHRNCVLVVNGSGKLWIAAGILNLMIFRGRRRVFCWDVFVEVDSWWKKTMVRVAMRGIAVSVVWSSAQVKSHAEFLRLPKDRFLFLPYKSNHSRNEVYNLPIGRFVFAGGNGKRDYPCLIDAVRGTDIPLIISATDPNIRNQIENLPNVIVVGAPEPAFAQLQAASAFVVIPMIFTGLKGGGEANFCNGMWHGKAVIAADSIAAEDYIIDGETGYVVPSGDAERLRERILELWLDQDKAIQMGKSARKHVERYFTHQTFIVRLLSAAKLIGDPYPGQRE